VYGDVLFFFLYQQASVFGGVFFVVVLVLYNKIDWKKWLLSGLYWKLCTWIPGIFCLML